MPKYTEAQLEKALMTDICYIVLRLLGEVYVNNSKEFHEIFSNITPSEDKQKELHDTAKYFAYRSNKQLKKAREFFGKHGIDNLIIKAAQEFDHYEKIMDDALDPEKLKGN